MAKYIGSLTADARGKVGGFILTRGSNGTNLKAHAVPVQPRSSYQLTNRATLASAIYAWRQLSQFNRQTWAALAPQYVWLNSLAQTYSPTALQLFTQAWFNAKQFNGTAGPAAPMTKPVVFPVDNASVNTSSGVTTAAAFYNGSFYTGDCFFSISSVINPTVTYTKGIRRRPMGVQIGAAAVDITSPWQAAYGELPVSGSTVSIRVVPIDPNSYISGTPITLAIQVS